jgi:hypothetical protein
MQQMQQIVLPMCREFWLNVINLERENTLP